MDYADHSETSLNEPDPALMSLCTLEVDISLERMYLCLSEDTSAAT